MQPIWFLSLASHMIPREPPGVIPESRAGSKPWAQPCVTKKRNKTQKKIKRVHTNCPSRNPTVICLVNKVKICAMAKYFLDKYIHFLELGLFVCFECNLMVCSHALYHDWIRVQLMTRKILFTFNVPLNTKTWELPLSPLTPSPQHKQGYTHPPMSTFLCWKWIS